MDEKEALFMKTAAVLRKTEMENLVAMQKYVEKKQLQAKKMPEIAKEDAQKALIRTGVTTRNGNRKRIIVSWE